MDYLKLSEADLEIGNRVFVSYLVKKVDIGEQKNGSKYMSLSICDQKIDLTGVKIFNASENMIEKIVAGKIYGGAIDVREFNSQPSYVVYNIEELHEYNIEDYITYEKGYGRACEIVNSFIGNLDSSFMNLVKACFDSVDNKVEKWAAGKSHHHYHTGGLMVHISEVASFCNAIYEAMEKPKFVNWNVLITSALLHDIGKCYEMELDRCTGNTEYTPIGLLEGHITLGIRLIETVNRALEENNSGVGDDDMRGIRHCILSHHGKLEWGSPVKPCTMEAVILHQADLLSANINNMREQMSKMEGGEVFSKWQSDGYKTIYKNNNLEEEE